MLPNSNIIGDPNMVEIDKETGEKIPRKDALIYEDRIVCHPDMINKIREGLKLAGLIKEE